MLVLIKYLDLDMARSQELAVSYKNALHSAKWNEMRLMYKNWLAGRSPGPAVSHCYSSDASTGFPLLLSREPNTGLRTALRSNGAKLPGPDPTRLYPHPTLTNCEEVPRKCGGPVTSRKTMALLLCHLCCSSGCYDDISPLLGLARVLADCEVKGLSVLTQTCCGWTLLPCHVRWHFHKGSWGILYNVTSSIV